MRKILMLIIAILFGMASGFAQVYNVNVSWTANGCDCLGTTAENYFKVTISIHDDANNEWVVQNKTRNTSDATATEIDIPVGEVQTYCGQIHQYTPSFTVYADVWYMQTSTSSYCCLGSGDDGPFTCQDFYDNDIEVFVGNLN